MNSLQPNASRKDVLYLKRTPTVTFDYHSGNPIPEAIKKYYVQQHLPVRNQSLAANSASHRREKRKLKSRQRCTSPPLVRDRSLNYNNDTTQKDISMAADKVTTAPVAHASTLPRHFDKKLSCLTYNLTQTIEKLDMGASSPVIDTNDNNEEDEEFSFINRPPSSLICIRPMNPSDNEDEDDDSLSDDNDEVYDDDDMITAHSVFMDIDDDHSSDESSPPLTASPKTLGYKESLPDIPPLSTNTVSATNNYNPTHLFPLPPQQNLGRRSTDTDLSDISDVIIQSSTTLDQSQSNNSHSTMTYSNLFLTTLQEEEVPTQQAQQQENSLHKSYSTSRSEATAVDTALLSEVAKEFKNKMLTTHKTIQHKSQSNAIDFYHAFTGKEAVDCLLSVLRIQDRAEAIQVGNNFMKQEFFYTLVEEGDENVQQQNLFLIDSTTDLYTFKEDLPSLTPSSSSSSSASEEDELSTVIVDVSAAKDDIMSSTDVDFPTGVYTEFASCYSPTCHKNDTPCYSWICQNKKLIKQTQSQVKEEYKRLWSESVPEIIFQSTPAEERKRQECIYELIYTEQDFVRDLQYLQKFWVEPLLSNEIINPARREQFVRDIFHNIADIRSANFELAKALESRQAEQYVVPFIGDVMLQHVRNFEPFIEYGAHQIRGKYHYELEKRKNPVFARFVEETERKPESRRLELNGYLTKPTTRLGRYNLLLREILKRTPDGNPDRTFIPQTMNIITDYLERVNVETGKSENLFDLQQLKERLEFKSPAEYVDLELELPQRQMLMKGRMKKKGSSSSTSADMQVFLLDHYLLITKVKYEHLFEKYKLYKKPIPLELLTVTASAHHVRPKRQSSVLPYSISSNIASLNGVSPKPLHSETFSSLSHKSNQFPISFIHHGRKGSSSPITLYTSAISMQQNWLKKIKDQQQILLSRKRAGFSMKPLMKMYFRATNRVNSTYAFTDSSTSRNQLLIGAEHGVYLLYYDAVTESYGITRIIAIERVTQVEFIPDCSQLLVLADKTLWAFPSDVLSSTSIPQTRKGRAISQNTSFFHMGECIGKSLLCVVKSNALSATIIRVLEPVSMDESKRSNSLFKLKQRLVKSSGSTVGLKGYKDLYLPSEASSISLLKSKMCIASPMEIGVVDMKTFGVQALLDPEDEALAFVFSRQDVRPVTIYRIQFAEYLVCYNEFAFLVDQRGRFIRSSNRIDWEGTPDSFALSHPYILAFEPDFIEVRNVHTGELAQIIRGQNIRCTSTNTHNTTVQVTMDDPENEGYQLIFQLEQSTFEGPLSS